VLLELHTDDPSRLARAMESLDGAVVVSESAPDSQPLLLDRIG
jgi:thymidine phosphorylase